MNQPIITIFIDMDGTIARFYEHANCLEAMYEPGFFLHLNEYEQMIILIKELLNNPNIRIIFLSAVPSINPVGIEEKRQWLTKKFPNTEKYETIFCATPANKATEATNFLKRELSKNDYLLDDYSFNLRGWEAAGGTGIKCVNEVQDLPDANSWQGPRVGAENPWYETLERLQTLFQISLL